MTDTPWTPGPWHVGVVEYVGEDDKGISIGRARAFDVAAVTMAGWDEPTEQEAATARLIAAAPEMAELLARLFEPPDDDGIPSTDTFPFSVEFYKEDATTWMDEARAILDRIQGA